MKSYKDIDSYIKSFPENVQEKLSDIYGVIRKAAPKATEKIAYGMPTVVLHKNLVHFAAYKNHIGFYPTPSGISAFKKELSKYITSKGAVQFPIDEKLPLGVIKKIVQFRVKENIQKVSGKK